MKTASRIRTAIYLAFVVAFVLTVSGLAIAGVDIPQVNRGGGAPGYDTTGTVQNETALIQNKPSDPNNIVIAHNDDLNNNGIPGPGLGISYSLNSGVTWLHSHISNPSFGMTFDPSVAVDTTGSVYATFVDDNAGYVAGSRYAVYIYKSTNKGASWHSGSMLRWYPSTAGWYLDKDWMTIDTGQNSPYKDNIYVAWQEDDLNNPLPVSYIWLTQTTPGNVDGGIVPAPVRVTETSRANPYDNGPVTAVAPNGDVYVAWLDTNIVSAGQVPGTIRLRKSTNGGASFDGPGVPGGSSVVATFTTVRKYPFGSSGATPYRQVSFPSIAADPTNSSNVYVVYAADPDGTTGPDDGDVYFTRSNDGGATWSTPAVLNNDGTSKSQFQPWIDVKPNGYIDVIWYDARNDPVISPNSAFDVYMTTSTDGGQTFPSNTRVSDSTFSIATGSGYTWIGEYPGLDVDTSTAYISWTGVLNGDADIWFDTMPNPSNTSGGTTVTVPLNNGVTATFANVAAAGTTFAATAGLTVYPAPSGYSFVPGGSYHGYFDISTTAVYTGPVEVTFAYDPDKVGPGEANLRLFHWTGSTWEDSTTLVDTANNTITGTVSSLSLFAIGLPTSVDTTPPDVSIASPAAYSIHPAGPVSIEFSAADAGGIKNLSASLSSDSLPGPVPVSSPSTPSLWSGLYTLTVTAEDNAGNTATKTILFVVYDPTAGFVTGGGWIIPEPAIGERASFGFVSKYLKGSTAPSGNLEFQYRYRTINLRSTGMYWLAVSANSAIFQGTATINGAGFYTYRVDATDGDETGGSPDHFKITVWQGLDTESNPIHRYEGNLAGGSIIVHKK